MLSVACRLIWIIGLSRDPRLAHNGLVGGSSPSSPTMFDSRSHTALLSHIFFKGSPMILEHCLRHRTRSPPTDTNVCTRRWLIGGGYEASSRPESYHRLTQSVITMRFGPTFRSVRMRPADGPSNRSGTLSRIRSLADYTIDTHESSFRKRHQRADTRQRRKVEAGPNSERVRDRLRTVPMPFPMHRRAHLKQLLQPVFVRWPVRPRRPPGCG
jgi:hypothetical protein